MTGFLIGAGIGGIVQWFGYRWAPALGYRRVFICGAFSLAIAEAIIIAREAA